MIDPGTVRRRLRRLEVDPELVYRTLTEELDVFGAFARAIVELLEEAGEDG